MNGQLAFIPIIETILDEIPNADRWCKGNMERYHQVDGEVVQQHCLAGAAAEAFRKLGISMTKADYIEESGLIYDFRCFAENQSTIDHDGRGVVAWNDSPGTTYEDVILWTKSLIDHCRDA